MKNIKILLLIILLMPIVVYAQRGCCSSHGGVAGCSSPAPGGKMIKISGNPYKQGIPYFYILSLYIMVDISSIKIE